MSTRAFPETVSKDPGFAERPNIIWVFGDQHRSQALSCHGDPNVSTPNIDRLAAEGVDFYNAISGSPLCCPYRGSLLSGRYPHQAVPGHQRQLNPDLPTIAKPFKDAGYHTSYFGKWHLDGFDEEKGRAAFHHIPKERRGGFDHWVGYENNNSPWDCWIHGDGIEGFEKLEGYETDVLTDRFISQIHDRAEEKRAGKGRPFFSALSVQPPHDPYVAPEQWMRRHNPATLKLRPNVPAIPRIEEESRKDLAGYYAAIENLDWNLGRIRQALADEGLERETIIIFFSDHGDLHGSQGGDRKTTIFEESIRVPFIIGGETPYYGRNFRRNPHYPINHVDIGPTSLGLCGIDQPEWMIGTDYSSCFNPDRPEPKGGFPDSAFAQLVIPTGHGSSPDRGWRCLVTADGWKYAVTENGPWALFDLNEDPYEQHNMAIDSNRRDIRKKLHARLKQWIDKTGDPFKMPAD